MQQCGQIISAISQSVELVGAFVLFGRAWWTFRNKGKHAAESRFGDVARLRQLIAEMIAGSGIGWGAGIIVAGLVLATVGGWLQV